MRWNAKRRAGRRCCGGRGWRQARECNRKQVRRREVERDERRINLEAPSGDRQREGTERIKHIETSRPPTACAPRTSDCNHVQCSSSGNNQRRKLLRGAHWSKHIFCRQSPCEGNGARHAFVAQGKSQAACPWYREILPSVPPAWEPLRAWRGTTFFLRLFRWLHRTTQC